MEVKMMKETQEEAATTLLENLKINKEEEEKKQQQQKNEELMAFVEMNQRPCYCGGCHDCNCRLEEDK